LDAELKEHNLDLDVLGLFDFLKNAIEGREYAKFLFTRNVSDALSLIKKFGGDLGFSVEDLSHLSVDVFLKFYGSSHDPKALLAESIASGKKAFEKTRHLVLPSLIFEPEDVFSFQLLKSEPNFITQMSVESETVLLS